MKINHVATFDHYRGLMKSIELNMKILNLTILTAFSIMREEAVLRFAFWKLEKIV